MNHKRPPLPAIIVVALLVIVSIYFIVTQVLSDKNGTLDRFWHHRSRTGECRP